MVTFKVASEQLCFTGFYKGEWNPMAMSFTQYHEISDSEDDETYIGDDDNGGKNSENCKIMTIVMVMMMIISILIMTLPYQ